MCSSGARRARSRSSSTSTGRRARAARSGKVLLPELGDHYGRVLEAGELVLVFDADGGSFHIAYYDNRFPIGVRHYPRLLQLAMERLGGPTTDLTRLVEGFAGTRRRRRLRREASHPPARGGCLQAGAGRARGRGSARAGRRSRQPSRRSTAPPASPRAFARSIACSTTRSIASPSGASPAPTSTTAASSTSTSWPGCGWSARRCSSRPTAWSCA